MPPPVSDPLIHASSLVYRGCFRLPANGGRYDFPAKGLDYNEANDSLFVCSYADFHSIGEISIPTPIIGAPNLNALNRATVLQQIADPSDGSWTLLNNGAGINLGGILAYGGRLAYTFYRFYDGDGTQPYSHWARNNLLLTPGPNYVGPVTLAVTDLVNTQTPHAGNVSGYMARIPAAWQEAFGGPCLTGQCGVSIVSRTSLGPDAFSFDPDDIGSVNPVPTTPLVFYPGGHATLGEYGNPAPNNRFNGTMQMGGVAFPEGFRSVLFFGIIGLGPYAYGQGTADPALNGQPVPGTGGEVLYVYDPQMPNTKGDHAYPYEAWVWAYDAIDLAAVAAGTIAPWVPVPYEVFKLDSNFYSFFPRLSGATVRNATGEIFVTQTFGDGDAPLVHVYQLPVVPTSEKYVATTGSNSNPGTISQPWRTISYALTQLATPDRLNIRGGTYAESLDMTNGWPGGTQGNSWATAITIRAYPGESVTVRPPSGSDYCVFMRGSFSGATNAPRYLIFQDILFDATQINSVGFYISAYDGTVNPADAPSHHIRCQRCRITGVRFNQGYFAGWGSVGCEFLDGEVDHIDGPSFNANNTQGFYVAASDFILQGTDIHDCWGYGVSNLSSLPGFDVDHHTIRANRVWNCGLGGTGLGGINMGEGINHRLYNNVVFSCLGPGINLRFNPGPGAAGLEIRDNTTVDNADVGIYISGTQVNTVVKGNISFGNGAGNYENHGSGTVESNNLFGVDPRFVDRAGRDFHLTTTSPARGAGIGVSWITDDYDGAPRPTSGPADAGAYQFGPFINSGAAAVSTRGPGVASQGQASGGGGICAVATKGPTINATGRTPLLGSGAVATRGPTINAGGGGSSVTGTAASATLGPTIAASGVAVITGSAAAATGGPTVLAAGGGTAATGTAALSTHGPAVAATGQGIASGYCLIGIAGPTVLASWRPDNTGTITVSSAGPRINGAGEDVLPTGTAASATAGPTIAATSNDNAGQAASATLGPTVAASGAPVASGTAALSTAGPTVQASGEGVGTTGTADVAVRGPSVIASEVPPHQRASVTGLGGICSLNQITITGSDFQVGATIVVTGYLGVVETFDIVSQTAIKIVLGNLNPPLLSRTQYCVRVTNP